MTVSSTTFYTDWSAADGVNKNWSYDFQIDSSSDVQVLVRDGEDNDSVVVINSNINFIPIGEGDEGYIVYPVSGDPLPSGKQVRVRRIVSLTQTTEIGNEGDFRPKIHEKAFDKLTQISQQLQGAVDRAIKTEEDGTGFYIEDTLADRSIIVYQDGKLKSGPPISDIGSSLPIGTTEGTVAAGNDDRIIAAEQAATYADIATAQSATVPARNKRLYTQFYSLETRAGAAHYKRVASEPDHDLKLRSQDRYLPDGSPDADDGGWWVIDEPVVTLKMAGAKGDGDANDAVALSAVFSLGLITLDDGGVYIIDGATIPVKAGTKFIGAHQNRTRFIFKNMGGFDGLDGFVIDVPIDPAWLHVCTAFSDCDILTDGEFGRDGIKTPCNPDGRGLELYGKVRPKYVFERLTMGSLTRTAVQSNSMFGNHGWLHCIHFGESADTEVRGCRFVQPFRVATAPETWGGRENSCAVFIDAGEVEAGAGPIYSPVIEGFTAHGCGKVIRTRGHVSCPRFSSADCFANGWGIYAESRYFSENTNSIDGMSEATIENMNLNGIFGGIYARGVDFLDIKAVRTTWPLIAGITYAGEWFGVKVEAGFRQVDIRGLRAACYDVNSVGTLRMFDLNSTYEHETVGTGLVNADDLYLSRANGPEYWEPAALRNIREAQIEPIKSRGANLETSMLYMESDWTSISPKLYITGPLPYTFTSFVEHGPGSSEAYVYAETVGTTDGWYWEKRADGTAECWKTFNAFAAPNVAAGNIFSAAEVEFDLPFTFAVNPVLTAAVRSGSALWANSRPISTTRGAARVFSATSVGTAVIVDVHVVGRWKP